MENFRINISDISNSPRPNGVSGMMRVKNDAEFIPACIESCIEALDELIIVYNDCTDNSPIIIEEMRHKYPDKIKVFHYLPKIKAWNLSDTEVDCIMRKEFPPEQTLAGYYNYALSKTTYRFVMKIDADQIYFSDKLKEICDLYRSEPENCRRLSSILFAFLVKTYLTIAIRLKRNSSLISNSRVWKKYISSIRTLVKEKKINTSLSGINLIVSPHKAMIPLGKEFDNGVNILPPYNGEGDHLIFKVTPKTYFVPIVDKEYNRLNKIGTSVIERLNGGGIVISIGLYWCHLNSLRARTFNFMKEYMKAHKCSFLELDTFQSANYYDLLRKNKFEMTSKGKAVHFDLIHNDLKEYEMQQILAVNQYFSNRR